MLYVVYAVFRILPPQNYPLIVHFLRLLYQALLRYLDREANQPPYPFDDDEGEKLWRKDKQVHDGSTPPDLPK